MKARDVLDSLDKSFSFCEIVEYKLSAGYAAIHVVGGFGEE
jgi:hypothetical protein